MIDAITNILGYSGTDTTVTYLCATGAIILTICLAYRFVSFLFSLVTCLCGSNDKISF